LEKLLIPGVDIEETYTVSFGTLIGIDQLVLGATTSCDLMDLDGEVAIPIGTAITTKLLGSIKANGVIGLIAGRSDFSTHHVTPRASGIEAIASHISEMQRRSGIAQSLTPVTIEFSKKVLKDSFIAIQKGRLPDPAQLNTVAERIEHDIELIRTAPLPSPRLSYESLVESMIDDAIEMAILMGWHLNKQKEDSAIIHDVILGGLLHDIGLLLIHPGILQKTEPLGIGEIREIRRHPYLGLRALSPLGNKIPKCSQNIILQHHEREDGSGYPLRRSNGKIPSYIGLAHIVDEYIALVSPRPHRKAVTPHRAIEILMWDSGKSHNREILGEFIKRTGRYPLGSAVFLSSNEVGIVVGTGTSGPYKPVVDIYFSKQHQFSHTPHRIDLSKDKFRYIRNPVK
jgi:hypothetical protein